ncbi:MAG: sulfite exporter TauE/SafE family protein [Xanthomonadales bacterium]|nr:sulfite exporter TauE/SafE family protein [Xanthomonadales bacterium]MCC6560448.1 sulfite exporter TauE/SafE family protein [Xanthomonadales bacterium]
MDLSEFLTFMAIGFAAQLVDGALGMGFGLVSNAVLLAMGTPPAASSAAIHAAKVFTGGASALSHAWFRNIDRRVFLHLVLPGMIGGLAGALVLQRAPAALLRFVISAYLSGMGLWLLLRALRNRVARKRVHALGAHGTGLVAGTLDAIGGGGWGTVVTASLIAQGAEPRYAVGTTNASEFFVAIAISATLTASLGVVSWVWLAGLVCGGILAAPVAAWLTRHLPMRLLTGMVGFAVIALSVHSLSRLMS